MLNNVEDAVAQLASLGLGTDEARLYLELLRGPNTHQQLSRATGINRTKVYRLAEQLEKRSLISRRADDRGSFLVASAPGALAIALVGQEEKLKRRREVLETLMPTLVKLQNNDPRLFVIRTYEGEAGLKQMLWHELKTRDKALAFGNGTIEQLSSDTRWANRHRNLQVAAGYQSRELINYDYSKDVLPELTHKKIMESKLFSYRILPDPILKFDNQTIVYNETVAIYHWQQEQKIGLEIISPAYAQMMRQIFEHYWQIAEDPKAGP